MHKTIFHWGQNDVVLFKDWVLHSPKETFFTCLFFVALGVCFHGIKFFRQQYGRRCQNVKCKRYILSKGHILQTLMYIVQFVWGYCLMLSVMTYNAWLLISVLAGFGLGYFFFGWGEFEVRSAARQLQDPSAECGKDCQASCSTSTTQELLLSPHEEVTFHQQGETSSIMGGCHCDDSQL